MSQKSLLIVISVLILTILYIPSVNAEEQTASPTNLLGLTSGQLVKNKEFAEVFWVDEELCLRWLVNEQAAERFYGPTWNHTGVIKEFEIIPDGYEFCEKIEAEESTDIPQNVWTVFQEFIEYAKEHDIDNLNKISYKPLTNSDDETLMLILDLAYTQFSQLDEIDFVNKWADNKQVILSTNPEPEDDQKSKGYIKNYIYFARNRLGEFKVLSVNIDRGWYHTTLNTSLNETQIEQELQAMMLDTDQDGSTDREEACMGADQYNPDCVKTDPNKRDTDGDGWWDGIEKEYERD